ncbi:MAG: alpha-L-fucosidase [Bacteroidetes bacterium]|nr:alpha-L-fucosidase [Bacteroidota bacterium]
MKYYVAAVLFTLISFPLLSQGIVPDTSRETNPLILQKLEQWRDLKFGLLMHWGTYSQWGIVESWSLCSEDEPWCKRNMKNYVDYCRKYEKLKGTFNPVKFDPAKWASAAKYAGMKYVVFTTKHHDGFCMFDTKETDYKITSPACPFSTNKKANVVKEIFGAFREKGFWTGAYFSKADWHCNDYWAEEWATPNRNVNYDIKKYPERWKKFMDFTYNQIKELMSGYGKMDILWLDGGWVCPQNNQDINMPKIAKMARTYQPELLIVDRTVTGKYENYRTPEQEIPDKPLDYPWETCMTMATSWSYVPGDTYKPTNKIIHLLVDIIAKGGNFLLNIGPSPEGEYADTAYARLKEIGDWMKINGEAVYKSRPVAPYKAGKVCFTSLADGTIYALYLVEANEKTISPIIEINGIIPSKGGSVHLLGYSGNLSWKKTDLGLRVFIPATVQKKPPCRYAWVFRIK